ncbi:hypothetical protein F5Y15DRAFT_394793 [Xylariaceae sp. FL0016]|nr:hypothetical protein F5Y15DRAFT_394793 [Xylariaceae sp. FL0016]
MVYFILCSCTIYCILLCAYESGLHAQRRPLRNSFQDDAVGHVGRKGGTRSPTVPIVHVEFFKAGRIKHEYFRPARCRYLCKELGTLVEYSLR